MKKIYILFKFCFIRYLFKFMYVYMIIVVLLYMYNFLILYLYFTQCPLHILPLFCRTLVRVCIIRLAYGNSSAFCLLFLLNFEWVAWAGLAVRQAFLIFPKKNALADLRSPSLPTPPQRFMHTQLCVVIFSARLYA